MVTKRFSSKRLVSVWMMVSFYALTLCVVYIVLTGNVNTTMIFRSIFPVSTKIYWFMSVYFFIAVFQPFINELLSNLSDRLWRVLIGLSFVACCILYFVYPKADLIQLESGYSLIWFIFLYIVGAYIGTHEFKKRPYFLLYLLACFVAFGGETLVTKMTSNGVAVISDYKVLFTAYNSPFVFMASVFLILSFKEVYESNISPTKQIIGSLGRYAIGIYLIHEYPYLRDFLWKNLFSPVEHKDELGIYLLFCIVAIMAAGILVECVRSKLANCIMNFAPLDKLMKKADALMLQEKK